MYDLIVIGAGPGGYEAALRAAENGMKTLLVEKDLLGGACLNRGCIPTKSLLHGAAAGERSFKTLFEQKDAAVNALRASLEGTIIRAGIDIARGHGRVLSPGRVSVRLENGETKIHEGRFILIASGARPALPPIPGLTGETALTSDALLANMDARPESIVIIGGGVIGAEFAEFFLRVGTGATILEGAPRLLPQMDRDLGQGLAQAFKKRGAAVVTDAMVTRLQKTDEGVLVFYTRRGREESVLASKALCAVGRAPNTDGLFENGLAPQMNGRVFAVSARYETSVPGVYAIGDAASPVQLAHLAAAQGRACVDMLSGLAPEKDTSAVPACVYTTPEIASVGLTEEEAGLRPNTVCVRAVTTGNGRNLISGGERAFVKLVADRETRALLGAHILGPCATELISQFTLAIVNGLSVERMLKAIHPHPTFDESVLSALYALKSRLQG